MAPKKQQQKMSLGDFLGDQTLGSWADEMDDQPIGSGTGGGGYGSSRPQYGSGGGFGSSDRGFERNERGFAIQHREELPLPSKPPYTAHLGNLSFDVTDGDVQDFFTGCEVTSVRIVEDKLDRKPKGFGYVEFATLDGLKKALELSGTQFQGRNVRISVAEPPKDRPEQKDMSDWTRRGPLPDLPGQRRTSDRGGYRGFDAGSDAGDAPRRRGGFESDGRVRDFGNWERKGPLSPSTTGPAGPGPFREGGRMRSNDGPVGDRRQSPAWGGSQEGSRPPRREFQERPVAPREPTAPELDNQWRARMRPDAAKSPSDTPETSTPSSPVPQNAAPAGRPRLNLAKRTVSEAEPAAAPASVDSKSNPFGAARPIDTAAREREVEEKRQLALRQKKEADEKAREERKAKEAAEKAKASVPPTPTAEKSNEAEKPVEILRRSEGESEEAPVDAPANGEIVDDKAVKPTEVERDAPVKSEGSWRKPSAPAAPAPSTTEKLEDDGWSTVPAKSSKKQGRGYAARAIAS